MIFQILHKFSRCVVPFFWSPTSLPSQDLYKPIEKSVPPFATTFGWSHLFCCQPYILGKSILLSLFHWFFRYITWPIVGNRVWASRLVLSSFLSNCPHDFHFNRVEIATLLKNQLSKVIQHIFDRLFIEQDDCVLKVRSLIVADNLMRIQTHSFDLLCDGRADSIWFFYRQATLSWKRRIMGICWGVSKDRLIWISETL